MIRAVLDTNVLISALLFDGLPSRLVPAWRSSRFHPVLSPPILDEYLRALAYPKFRLTPDDIRSLLEEEILPFFETVQVNTSSPKPVRDPDDAKFVACAVEASVPWIVSGDADLLDLGRVKSVRVVTPRAFLDHLKRPRA